MNRRKFKTIGFGAVTGLLAFSFSIGGFAKTVGSSSVQYHLKKKSPSSNKMTTEVYPALETDEGEPISTTVQNERKTTPTKLAQNATPLHSITQTVSQTTEKQKDYDIVPAQLNSPLIRRLQIVQVLVQKYNRAYDYRTHTTAELEKILLDLNSKQNRHQTAEQLITMAPAVEETTSGDAEKSSDPLFSGNVEDDSILETLPDLPPPNPA